MDEEEPRSMAPEPLEEQPSLPGEAASSESVSDEGVSQCSVHLEELSARQEQTASDAGCEQPSVSLPVKRHHADEKENVNERKRPKGLHGMVNELPSRSSKSVIHAVFRREYSLFTVTKKCTDYLQYMGVPLKSGGHVLFPEEVVFLIELGKILATDNNNILGLDDGFRLLHECGIPFHKYRAYCALRRAGFVVMRPERSQVRSFLQNNTAFKIVANDEDALPPPTGARCSKQCFPKELLDAFPTVRRDMLICSQLQRNNRLVPVEDLSDFSFDPYAFRIPRKSSRDFRRQLRPEYWPAFDSFRCSILNWAEFAHRRSEAIVSARRAADIRRFNRLRKNQSVYDFEAFLSEWFMHTVSKDPAFRVICFDSRKGALSCPFMHTHSGKIPLMFSISDYGYICFVELSGEPIDLNRYLEELSKKS